MEPKITDEELKLLNALYWWQMTGNWPRRINRKYSLGLPRVLITFRRKNTTPSRL